MRRTLEVPNETGVPAQAWRWAIEEIAGFRWGKLLALDDVVLQKAPI